MAYRSKHSPSSIAYGSGSTKKDEPMPDWRTAFTPPPNRLQNLDISRFAGFDRKVRGAALAETLILDWLEDQALNTVPSQINLAELNRATRILYRLTAIQKTLMGLHSELHKDPSRPAPATGDGGGAPIEPLDDDPDDEDEDPVLDLPTHASPTASPALPEDDPSYNDEDVEDEDEFESEETTDEDEDDSDQAGNIETETAQAPIAPQNQAPQTPNPAQCSPDPSDSNSEIDNSAFHIPHSALGSPRAASVRAVPTLPHLDEAYLDRTLDLTLRLTGARIPADAYPQHPDADSASQSSAVKTPEAASPPDAAPQPVSKPSQPSRATDSNPAPAPSIPHSPRPSSNSKSPPP